MRMSQRINRSQKGGDTEKGGNSNYDANQSRHDGDNQSPPLIQEQNPGNEEKESTIVALEPEDNFKNPLNMNPGKGQNRESS